MKDFPDPGAMVKYIADAVESLSQKEGFPFSEIAILYTSKKINTSGGEVNLPEELMKALDARGIISTWASEDYRAKMSYDITTNSVTISTIYSAKGLDYACVFVVGLDFMKTEKMTEDEIVNLTYVGLTRARYRLFIPYMQKTPLVNKLLAFI